MTVGSAAQLLAASMSVLGVPYHYTGTDPQTGFDCSGFTQWVYQQIGVNIGRATPQQLTNGQVVGRDQDWTTDMQLIQPFDLIFYGYPGASGPNAHVVMYIGDNKVIQAGGSDVNITNVFQSASSDEPFLGVRRYVNFGGPQGATLASNFGPEGNTSAPSYQPVPGGAITTAADETANSASGICQLTIHYGIGSFCAWEAGWTRAILGGLLLGAAGVTALVATSVLTKRELMTHVIPGVSQLRSIAR